MLVSGRVHHLHGFGNMYVYPGDLRPPGPPGLDSKHGWPGPTEEVAIWGWISRDRHMEWPLMDGSEISNFTWPCCDLWNLGCNSWGFNSPWKNWCHRSGYFWTIQQYFFMKGTPIKRALLSYFFGLAVRACWDRNMVFWRFFGRILETYEIHAAVFFEVRDEWK